MSYMLSLAHALREGAGAARLTSDPRSAWRLRADFLFSRLLRLARIPGADGRRQVRLGGLTIHYRFNRGDMQSLREVFVDEVYACDLPFQPRTVLDLGANIGLTSLWMARRFESEGYPIKIVAVEALPDNAGLALLNFEANAMSGEVIPTAVGPVSGEAFFQRRSESNLGRVVPRTSLPTPDVMRVPVTGIRELLNRFPHGRVDLVKMDIEGAEEQLLITDPAWLDAVRALMVEWHDEVTPSAPLISLVEGAGFLHRRINAAHQENLSLFTRKS